MAKTKFLDYTGLAKLVEKIKNTYVNIGGSTMTGTLKTLENQPAINFRPNNSGHSVTLNYDTESAEALAINLKNPSTSFMINSGVDGTTWTGEGHQSKVTPTIQVRKNCVSINKYIADNITPEYKLDVNGDVKANSFTGKLNGNANTASKLGTATVGGATKPMYLNGGTPTECTYTLAQNVTSASKLTDTTYSASTGLSLSKDNKFSINAATSSTIGGVKIGSGITVDTGGTISLTKTNVTNALGYTPPKADTNTTYTFTNGTGGTFTVKASNSDSGQTVSVGVPAKASAATSAETAATAATAEKVGTATVGGASQPIYLSGGKPTKCTYTLAQSVTSTSKLTDHLYNAGEGLKLTTGTTADTFSLSAATSSTIGGVKIGNNISITSGTISLTKANVTTALGYTPPTADTNTHYTTGLIVGNSSSSTGNTAVTTNGVFLNLKDDNNIRNSHKIVGGGATTVTSDSGGSITIHSTDTIYTLSRNVNNHAKISLTSVNGSDDITIDNVENAGTATRLSTSTAGGETQPVYFDGGIPKPLKYTIGKSVPSDAVFTDEKVKQVINTTDRAIHPILFSAWAEDYKGQMPQENHACINWNISVSPQDGTLKATNIIAATFDGDTFNGNTFTGKADSAFTADKAYKANKLFVSGGSVDINNVLVIGNYKGGRILNGNAEPGDFTPSGIVSMITDPDIENEIKKPIVWPTA